MTSNYHMGIKVHPDTRGDCDSEREDRAEGDRCVFRHCKHFISASTGCADSCTLDIIDREGPCSDEVIGSALGESPFRISQLAHDLERQVFERVLLSPGRNTWLGIISDTLGDDAADRALTRAVEAHKADEARARERGRDKRTLPLFQEAAE